MTRSKRLLGVTATALSVAAIYGVKRNSDANLSIEESSAESSSPSSSSTLLRTDQPATDSSPNNDSTKVAPSPPSRIQSLAGIIQKLPQHAFPFPTGRWDSEWDGGGGGDGDETNRNLADSSSTTTTTPITTPTATRHLFLIRHGQYHLERKLDEDRKLTELGREQLDMTGLRLKELGFRFDRIVASTLTRAQESARIVHRQFPNLPFESDPLLEEGAPARPEPPVDNWAPTAAQYEEDGRRIEAAFKKYFYRASPSVQKDTYEVIVCHGNVIRYFVCRGLQLPPEAWLRIGLNHGSVTWMSIRPSGRVVLHSLGVCGHMPPKKMTAV